MGGRPPPQHRRRDVKLTGAGLRPAIDDPAFIVGSGRSGTTLLALLLNTVPGLSFRRETGLVWHVLNDVPGWVWRWFRHPSLLRLKGTFDRVELPAFGLDQAGFETLVATSRTRKQFLDRFYYLETTDPGVRLWGENCPGDTLVMDRILDLYPGARFIHAYRDPRDVVHSFLHKDFGPDGAEEGGLHWLLRVRLVERFAAVHPDRVLHVCFEELIADPESTMARVLAYLGVDGRVDYDAAAPSGESLAPEYRRHIDATNTGKWRRAPDFDAEPVLRLCGGEMTRLGYLDEDPHPQLERWRRGRVRREVVRQRSLGKLRTLRRLVQSTFSRGR